MNRITSRTNLFARRSPRCVKVTVCITLNAAPVVHCLDRCAVQAEPDWCLWRDGLGLDGSAAHVEQGVGVTGGVQGDLVG